eukprot:05061.XXX_189702_191147_1 [CDS] Oithona nana genome sequencing.
MTFTTVLIAVFIFLLTALWFHLNRFRSYVYSLGIPVDRRIWWRYQKVSFKQLMEEQVRNYGKLFVQYDSTVPFIVIAEPDMIKEVMVKHFDSFTNRQEFGVEERHASLADARDDIWAKTRKALSPTFTSGKLKGMTSYMDKVASTMIDHLEDTIKTKGPIVNIKEVFQMLSLDTIGHCAFGIDTNSFKNPENELLKRCFRAFNDLMIKDTTESFFFNILKFFPGLARYIDLYGKENYDWLRNMTKTIADNRKESRNDFIDRLNELNADQAKHHLSEEVIMAQGIAFFIAGYETTSNTLSTLCYNLAKNPEVQEKVYEEISRVTEENDGLINHETTNQMPYLEATIEEDLRIHPPVLSLDRECSKDTKIGDLMIKKGVNVLFPIWALHHSEDFFQDPKEFRPERFLKETKEDFHPYAYLPFGGGPRKCIGLRFAMIEMKLALAKLLQKYRIVAVPETKLDFFNGDVFLLSYPEVKVKLETRE